MKFIIKLFPEITIKSRPVRKNITKQLRRNLKEVVKATGANGVVESHWDNITIEIKDEDPDLLANVVEALKCTPGCASILEVASLPFTDLDDAYQKAKSLFADKIVDKTFCVRVKRSGDHDFTSTDAERYIGGGLNQLGQSNGVKLKGADVTLKLEIRDDQIHLIKTEHQGLGGYPLGAQGAVVSLISGGFDSTVASYLMMKRGLVTNYLFFNLGGSAHEVGVKQVSHYLWNKYSASHPVKFITVNFEQVVAEILESVHHKYMGVMLKRLMLKAAEKVLDELGIDAMVTGEAIGQVSSQTLTNLSAIDQATERLVLRPLIQMDKPDIINISREIGAEEFAATMPEYCGVISDNPTTKARMDTIREIEDSFNFEVLTKAIENKKVERIDYVLEAETSTMDVALISTPKTEDVIIDIRAPQEEERNPLILTNNKVIKVPFYKLESYFETLNTEADRHLLYCKKGTMSQLHAHHLKVKGFENVAVFKEQKSD